LLAADLLICLAVLPNVPVSGAALRTAIILVFHAKGQDNIVVVVVIEEEEEEILFQYDQFS